MHPQRIAQPPQPVREKELARSLSLPSHAPDLASISVKQKDRPGVPVEHVDLLLVVRHVHDSAEGIAVENQVGSRTRTVRV